jgi:hypothetical protein
VELAQPPHLWELPARIAADTLKTWTGMATGQEAPSLGRAVFAPLKATRKALTAYNRRSLVPIPKFLRED